MLIWVLIVIIDIVYFHRFFALLAVFFLGFLQVGFLKF